MEITMYEIRAALHPWGDGVNFLILERTWDAGNPKASKRVVTGLTVTDKAPGEWLEPTLSMTAEMAQQLMDNLWAAGLRPTDGKGSAATLEAAQRHLEDMRRLVFERAPQPSADK
jgi:hypothetical protein